MTDRLHCASLLVRFTAAILLLGGCQQHSPPAQPIIQSTARDSSPRATSAVPAHDPLISDIPDFALTNEFGAPIRLRACKGQAVALTFFFTRCPLPEFCPRLSRNFAEASHKLVVNYPGVTNWHFFSISFDPLDTPAVLRRYALGYGYDSNRWSFVTGDPTQIRALTAGFGLKVVAENGGFNHDFRTVIFDAGGHVQAIWPMGGNTSDPLVQEIVKGAAVRPNS